MLRKITPRPRRGGVADQLGRAFRQDRLAMVGVVTLTAIVLVALFADLLVTHPPRAMNRDPASGAVAALLPPSADFWLGTDNLGRDVYSQVVFGTRSALVVGFSSALLTTLIGGTLGLIAGYYGGRVDAFIMRVVDVAYAIPFEPFVILVLGLANPSLGMIVVAMALLMWRQPARVVRAQVLSLRERPFVKAARISGASNARIVVMHIGPNILPLFFLYAALTVGWAIIAEASMSFLGFGDPRVVSWGGMLQSAFVTGAIRDAWWWAVSPGAAITALVISFFFVTRALQAATSPITRK